MTREDIDALLKKVEKSVKCEVGTGDKAEFSVNKIASNIPVLDKMIGGGFVRGRIHIFSGEFSTGKTLIAQKIIATSQQNGGVCVFVDAERRYDSDWFKTTGINTEELIVVRPNFGEEAIDAILAFLREKVDVLVIDSIAALSPLAEVEAQMEQQFIGLQSRMLSTAFRKIVPANSNTVLIGTNQLRKDVGSRFRPGMVDKLAGGDAQLYYASLVLRMRRKGWIYEGGEVSEDDKDAKKQRIGFNVECISTKCNFAPPQQICTIPFNFNTGELDNVASVVSLAVSEGIIEKSGSWYTYGKLKAQGDQGIREKFIKDPDEYAKLRKELRI